MNSRITCNRFVWFQIFSDSCPRLIEKIETTLVNKKNGRTPRAGIREDRTYRPDAASYKGYVVVPRYLITYTTCKVVLCSARVNISTTSPSTTRWVTLTPSPTLTLRPIPHLGNNTNSGKLQFYACQPNQRLDNHRREARGILFSATTGELLARRYHKFFNSKLFPSLLKLTTRV